MRECINVSDGYISELRNKFSDKGVEYRKSDPRRRGGISLDEGYSTLANQYAREAVSNERRGSSTKEEFDEILKRAKRK